MDAVQLATSTQEQAIAAWIDHLNQIRLDTLLARLTEQDENLESALQELCAAKICIAELISKNRGGETGLHGYIAEAAEYGVANAKQYVEGAQAIYRSWINNNGPADLLRMDGTEIQQKFVNAGGHFSLDAIVEHLDKYPDFIKNGGKYLIPKDFYDKIERILAISEEDGKSSPGIQYQQKVSGSM